MTLELAPLTGAPRGPGADGSAIDRAGVPRPGAAAAGTPVGIAVGWGSAAIVLAACVAALVPVGDRGWRFALILATVAVFAAVAGSARAVAMVAGIGWLVYTGFLLDSLGVLSWHGPGDLWRALLLAAGGAAGLAAGAGYRWSAARRGAGTGVVDPPVAKITVLPRVR